MKQKGTINVKIIEFSAYVPTEVIANASSSEAAYDGRM